jgi:hypothetical protein
MQKTTTPMIVKQIIKPATLPIIIKIKILLFECEFYYFEKLLKNRIFLLRELRKKWKFTEFEV